MYIKVFVGGCAAKSAVACTESGFPVVHMWDTTKGVTLEQWLNAVLVAAKCSGEPVPAVTFVDCD